MTEKIIKIPEDETIEKLILQESPLPFQQNPRIGDKVSCNLFITKN